MKKKQIISGSIVIFVIVLSVTIVNVIKSNREKAFQEKLNSEQSYEMYSNGKTATYEQLLAEADIEIKDIHGVTIGLQVDGDFRKFYVSDSKVVSEICERFKSVKVHGSSGKLDAESEDAIGWNLTFYSDKPYAITTYAYKLVEPGNYKTMIWVTEDADDKRSYTENVNGEIIEKDVVGILDNYTEQLILDEELLEYIEEIYANHVKNITKEDILLLMDNNQLDMEHIFTYRHSKTNDEIIQNYQITESVTDSLHINYFKFPIANSDCFMEVQKGEHKQLYGILKLNIVNADGEKLDMFQTSPEEIEAFLQVGDK